MKGSSGDPTRSLQFEMTGSTSGVYSLSDAIAAKTGAPASSLSDFYGYTYLTAPSAPTKCNTAEDATGVLALWFDTSDNEDNFRLEYRVNGGAWVFSHNPAADTTSAYIQGYSCVGGDTVAIRVRAENGVGNSSWCTDNTPVTVGCV